MDAVNFTIEARVKIEASINSLLNAGLPEDEFRKEIMIILKSVYTRGFRDCAALDKRIRSELDGD
jgi:hypothetical protein